MDFIVDNYFWFIAGGIVVLMIVIGYIAEQTDFGRKPFGQKKKDVSTNPSNTGATEEILEPVVNIENEEFNSSDFTVENDISDVSLAGEDIVENIPESSEEVAGEEIVAEDVVDEPMQTDFTADLDVPEITNEEVEDNSVDSDVIEEVISEDSEDDVWKF